MSLIHSTAVIAAGARLGEGTSVGPFSVIGPDVIIGQNNRIGSHVVIEGITRIGDGNQFFQFASVGAAPQDLKFHGEPSTLHIGDKNIIREYVTLQPGTEGGGMKTTVGNRNLFMACSHLGHDGLVGDDNVIANSVALAGHVTIGNGVTLGGLAGVHQFVRIGDWAIIGAGAMVTKDIIPFSMAQGDRAGLVGLNKIGLERRGVSPEDVRTLRNIYRELFVAEGDTFRKRVDKLSEEHANFPHAKRLLDFILKSERGVAMARSNQD